MPDIDNYWLDTKTPCLTYGLRGINYYEIKISGPDRDLHSGVFGGTVHEPMTDLVALSKYIYIYIYICLTDKQKELTSVYLVSRLVTPDGQILVSGVKDLIAPVTDDERAKFEAIHFEMQDIHAAVGGEVTISDDTVKTVSFLVSEKNFFFFLFRIGRSLMEKSF